VFRYNVLVGDRILDAVPVPASADALLSSQGVDCAAVYHSVLKRLPVSLLDVLATV